MKKRLVYKIVVGIILYFVLGIIYKYYKNSTLERTCLTNNFIQNYSDLTYLEINSTHDFDEIFDCEEWNEILVTDAHYYMRGFGYLKNGVLVPAFDQIQYPKGTYLVYFLEKTLKIIFAPQSPIFVVRQRVITLTPKAALHDIVHCRRYMTLTALPYSD